METLKIVVKEISAEETIAVRHPVLRQGRPIEDCYFIGDALSTTVHYGVFEELKLAGIATFLEQNNPQFQGEHLQLRGMAVLDEFKGRGFGKLLLKTGEQLAKTKKKDVLWFNARESALPFYQKQGYKKVGNSFIIPDVGIHFVMFKNIALRNLNK